MEQATSARNKKLYASLALLILVVVIVGGVIVTKPKSSMAMKDTATAKPTTSSSASSTPNTTPATTASSSFKDGTYTATGSYSSPGGTESLKVTLTLANDGTITDSTVKSEANDPTAATYQSYFVSNYKPSVVGKSITSINLSNVSGSSLTSQGFKDALTQIEKQAQA